MYECVCREKGKNYIAFFEGLFDLFFNHFRRFYFIEKGEFGLFFGSVVQTVVKDDPPILLYVFT